MLYQVLVMSCIEKLDLWMFEPESALLGYLPLKQVYNFESCLAVLHLSMTYASLCFYECEEVC